MDRAVVFDVDGVIRHNNASKKDGCYYCLKYEDVDYIDGIFKAHKYLQTAGYKIFWVTMQNCIQEGLVTWETVSSILNRMWIYFKDRGIDIDGYRICQSPDESDESKVKSKVEAIMGFSNIDLSKSIGIGDRKSDIDAYKLSGIGATIQALTPYGDKKCNVNYHYDSPLCMKNDGRGFAHPEVLSEVLMVIHGCNDVPRLTRIAENFPHVKKVWGDEYWIVNSLEGSYCSKILILNPDHVSSLHYHKNKCETFTVLAGIVKIKHKDTEHICITGDSILINPENEHRFEALISPAVILETSTWHDDCDTYRIEESK